MFKTPALSFLRRRSAQGKVVAVFRAWQGESEISGARSCDRSLFSYIQVDVFISQLTRQHLQGVETVYPKGYVHPEPQNVTLLGVTKPFQVGVGGRECNYKEN